MVKYGLSTMIGENQIGLPYPVFFDPHYCIANNKSPITLITGGSGSGKTFYGLTLASHSGILGKLTFIIDPKGDFILLKKLEQLGYLSDVRIWSVINSEGTIDEDNIGVLDPTSFYDNFAENVQLTIDVISSLVGKMTQTQENALIPIVRDVVEEGESASLAKVVQNLLRNRVDEIRNIGIRLESLLQLPLSKLLSKNKRYKRKPIALNKGIVVASLLGLSIPASGKEYSMYTGDEKISVAIMELLTTMVLDIMKYKSKKIYKTLIVDEAWMLLSTPQGRSMMAQVGLLGRSINMASILLTQSPSHIDSKEEKDFGSSISSRFAFRNPDSKDNKITVSCMGLSEEENWESFIPKFPSGVCLMQDSMGNVGIIHITVPHDWKIAFDTNPDNKI